MNSQRARRVLSRLLITGHHTGLFVALLVLALLQFPSPIAVAISEDDSKAIYQWPLWNPTIGLCGINTSTGTGPVSTSGDQLTIIKTIIGIAKTDNLGQAGALIGLMVGDDESSFTVYANSTVPISLSIPHTAVEGAGGAHSVGVFQQQPDDGWSTLANGAAALTNQAAVAQNMDPAYSAEAFFGSPPGTQINAPNPGALTKGLMDVPGWQSMQPWVAAQAVQHSGTLDGSNYEKFVSAAQALVNQYYDSSPAVPLPVPFTGGTAGSGATSTGNCQNVTINCQNPSASVASSPVRQNVVCIADQQLALWQSGQMTVGFRANNANSFSTYSQNNDELWCADFVSWVYMKANYPVQPLPNWRNAAVVGLMGIGQQNQNFHWHPAGGYTPKPGDMIIHNQGGEQHVNIVTAVSGNTMTVVGGDQDANASGYPDGSRVSGYQDAGFSGVDNITGYVSPD